MPESYEQIELDVEGGLNLAADPVRLPKGDFAKLDNAAFDRGVRKRKRHGHKRLEVWDPYFSGGGDTQTANDLTWLYGHGYYDPAYPYTSPISNRTGPIKGLLVRDEDLVAWNGFKTLSRDEGGDSWARHGRSPDVISNGLAPPEPTIVCHAPETPVLGTRRTAVTVDMAKGDVRTCYAWIDPTDFLLRVTVTDNATGASVVSALEVAEEMLVCQAQYGRSATGAGYFFVTCHSATNTAITATIVPELDPKSFQTYSITATVSAQQPFDSRPFKEGVIVVWEDAGALNYAYVKHDATAPSTGTLTTTLAPLTDSPVAVAVHPDNTFLVCWTYSDGTLQVRSRFYSGNTFAPVHAEAYVNNGSATTEPPTRLACEFMYLLASAGTYRGCVAWSQAGTAPVSYLTRIRHVQGDSTTGSYRELGETCLTHQAFRVGDVPFMVCAYVKGTSLQPAYVVLACDAKELTLRPRAYPVACVARGAGTADNSPSTAVLLSTSGADYRWSLLCGTARLVLSEASLVAKDYGQSRIDLDFDAPLRSVQAGKSVYVAGGVVQEYDGERFQPAGHLFYPEVTLTAVNGAGTLTPGTYTYRVYLLDRTSTGEFVRSAAITKTITFAGPNDTVNVVLPPVPFNYRDQYRWEIYRSQVNATFLTLVAQTDPIALSSTYADARFSYLTYADVSPDGTIVNNAADPSPATSQSGLGVLDPIAPPNCEIIAVGKERVWFAGGGIDAGSVAFSRLYDPGEAPTWNEALTVSVDRFARPITGVGFINDAVAVFKADRVYVFGGAGPDNLGNDGFGTPRTLSAEAGCISPDSVIMTPYGLAFQSRAGIRALNPGFQVVDIGEPVDPATSPSVALIASVSSDVARFHGPEFTLALDYGMPDRPRWSRYTYGAKAACVWKNYTAIAPTGHDSAQGLVWHEDPSLYLDGGVWYSLDADLGWIVPDTTGSAGRVRWWGFVGSYFSDHRLVGTIRYDYGNSAYPWQWAMTEGTTSVDVSPENIDDDVQGWDGSYGSAAGAPWYPGQPYAFRKNFHKSRAGCFRLRIRDVAPHSTGGDLPETPVGAAWGLSGLTVRFRPRTDNGMMRRGARNFSRN